MTKFTKQKVAQINWRIIFKAQSDLQIIIIIIRDLKIQQTVQVYNVQVRKVQVQKKMFKARNFHLRNI